MRMIRAVVFSLLCSGSQALSAPLGTPYDSYRDMHRETAYGSLFFNETAIRHSDNLERKRFRAVSGNGDVELPTQQGYCFVFNHYGRPTYDRKTRNYRAKITKTSADGTSKVETVEQSFDPTDDPISAHPPDLCVSGIRNVSKVAIDFTSDDGDYFDWHISFVPR